MKNVYICLSFLVLLCAKSRGQGSDVIFLVDNSGSIDETQNGAEYSDLQTSIASIMNRVLECNPENRIAVVQYSAGTPVDPRIFIETDFVNTAYTFSRRYFGGLGRIPASVNLLSDALNGVLTNPGVTSTQKILTRTPGNALVVYLFTDATRNNDLVAGVGTGNAAFQSYTDFKNEFGSTFIVTLITTSTAAQNAAAIAAAASIASVGGSYNGTIEGYPNDPQGQTTLPRYLLDRDDFLLSALQIQIITDDICSVAVPECVDYLTLISGSNDVTIQDNRQTKILIDASNKIYSGGVGIYHSEDTVLLKSGFHSANGSRFRGYIDECNSGYFGRPGTNLRAVAEDETSLQRDNIFTLSPNPASEMVTISATDTIQSIMITSIDGKVIFSKDLHDKTNSFELPVRDYIDGFYAVSVTTITGKVETQKLIKD